MNRSRPVARAASVLLLAGLLLTFACGCGTGSGSEGNPGGDKSEQVRNGDIENTGLSPAETRAKRIAARKRALKLARQSREAERLEAQIARAKARKAARQARAESRRIRIRARALARRGGDVDCGSFASQATAQLYLLGGDPFGLDADGDGVACADLPCPCSIAAGGDPGDSGDAGGTSEPPVSFRGTVVDVADGDTLDVTTPSGAVETVRIIGIDTPEVYGGTECGGPVASATMKRLATGQKVTVTSDPTQDRRDHYGRLLAYIDRGSQDLGFTMVKRGLASAYPYDGPFQRYPRYARADSQARADGTGSWSRCDISPG